jgi:hypothetical protein
MFQWGQVVPGDDRLARASLSRKRRHQFFLWDAFSMSFLESIRFSSFSIGGLRPPIRSCDLELSGVFLRKYHDRSIIPSRQFDPCKKAGADFPAEFNPVQFFGNMTRMF